MIVIILLEHFHSETNKNANIDQTSYIAICIINWYSLFHFQSPWIILILNMSILHLVIFITVSIYRNNVIKDKTACFIEREGKISWEYRQTEISIVFRRKKNSPKLGIILSRVSPNWTNVDNDFESVSIFLSNFFLKFNREWINLALGYRLDTTYWDMIIGHIYQTNKHYIHDIYNIYIYIHIIYIYSVYNRL